MECVDVRKLADAFVDGELAPEAAAAVRRHAEGCPACFLDLEARRELRAGLRRAFERSPALTPPADLEDSVRRHLALHAPEAAPGTGRTWHRRWAMAAAILVVVGAGALAGLARLSTVAGAIASAAAGDHRNCALRFQLAEQPIPLEDAAARFDPALALLASSPPDLSAGPAGPIEVVARHSCVYDNRRYGHVVLRYDGTLVSLLVTSRERSSTLLRLGAIGHGRTASDGELNTVQFQTSRHSIIVVGELPAAVLRQLAAQIAEPVAEQIERI